jgi:arylsulfatase A-like enzyme
VIVDKHKQTHLFLYLLMLTGVFVFFEICFFIHWTSAYLGDYKLIADQLVLPNIILPDIVVFLIIQISLHFSYVLSIWIIARLIKVTFNLSWEKTEAIGFILWAMGLSIILLANQYFFPNSKFSELLTFIVPSSLGLLLLLGLISIMAAVLGIASIGLMLQKTKIKWIMLVSLVFLLVVYGHGKNTTKERNAPLTFKQPNIIIIGIDSLRPDFLGFFGGEKQTPYLDNFLDNGIVFADAFTPLASTFPAWVSILTGEYPKHSGARTVLADQSHLNLQHTLPAILRNHGYETIFATDETRFSNIENNFGFEHIVSPPIGVNDFLLGTLNDFPLSNLLINTSLGRYLFPYSYANRGIFSVYDPNSFLNLIADSLQHINQRPLFLAVHFCLPHFPYTWGTALAKDKPIQNYEQALGRVDQQFNDFMHLLAVNQVLNHSIVIVLSDHGEAFELQGDRATTNDLFISAHPGKVLPHFYPPSADREAINQSGGHGTDILSLTQYHVLLAFRFFDDHPPRKSMVSNQVSLLDIKPTLLSLLKMTDDRMDGHSLLNLIEGKRPANDKNDLILESSFSPAAVRSVHPETKDVLFQGIHYFQIDPTTAHLVIKNEMMKLIVSSKQYADIYGDWMLALYPQSRLEMMPILLNLKTGEWTNDLKIPFALHVPIKHMLNTLKHFYGHEMTVLHNA